MAASMKLIEESKSGNIRFAIYERDNGKYAVYVGGYERYTKKTLRGAHGVIDRIVNANAPVRGNR